jgi:TatD DNase family protein
VSSSEENFVRARSAGETQNKTKSGKFEFPPLPEPLPFPVYDNHTHLEFQFFDELPPLPVKDHLDRAESVGVQAVVQVGVTLESSVWCAEQAQADPRILAAVAIHPNEAPDYLNQSDLDDAIAQIYALAKQDRVRAVGETGLDFFRTDGEHSIRLQRHSFEEHIRIAKENNIALMIHDRDAHDEVVATLKRVGAPERTVFHCFSGDVELAKICNEEGWFMSFAGNITIKRNQHLRDALRFAHKELVLVETDAPFLAPEPFRGRPNTSYLIPVTVRAMAVELQVELESLCQQLAQNTESVYGSWGLAKNG